MGTTQKIIRSIFAWYDRWSGAFWDRAQAEMLDSIETTAVKNNPQETPMADQPKSDRPDGDRLLPCPGCECADTRIEEIVSSGEWRARCERCGLQTCWWHSEQEARDHWNTRASPSPTRDGAEGAGDDPTSSAQWNEGCDFAMMQLCAFLGIDPHMVSWDAATETVDGDVRAVIGNILHAKLGEDWSPAAPPKPAPAMRNVLAELEEIATRAAANGHSAPDKEDQMTWAAHAQKVRDVARNAWRLSDGR